jgi:hypothetical protein
MRGAFVVRLRTASEEPAGPIEGSVEEVDTGEPYRFRSEEELLQFLRLRFAESRPKEGSE